MKPALHSFDLNCKYHSKFNLSFISQDVGHSLLPSFLSCSLTGRQPIVKSLMFHGLSTTDSFHQSGCTIEHIHINKSHCIEFSIPQCILELIHPSANHSAHSILATQ